MKQKDGFQRMTIDQMKALKEQRKAEKIVKEVMGSLDEQINEEAEKLAQELVDSGMDVDSFHIAIDVNLEEDKLIVHFNVVQQAKTMVFDSGKQ